MSFLKVFLLPLFFISHNYGHFTSSSKKITIVLVPAGNHKNPGRIIDKTYERTITHSIAQALGTLFEEERYDCECIIAQSSGKSSLDQLQHVSITNSVHADLVIILSAYQQDNATPSLSLYHSPTPLLAQSPAQTLSFVPFEKIHTPHAHISKQYAHVLYDHITTLPHITLTIKKPIGLPLVLHEGINTPALSLECGFASNDHWQLIIQPLTQAFHALFDSLDTIKKTKKYR